MHQILTRLAVVSWLVVLAFAPSAGAQSQTKTVPIEDFFFSPPNITVTPGTTVTWVNNGQASHTVTATNPSGAFDSGTLQPGQSFSFTFDQPGDFAYYCAKHPYMTGTVTVSGGDGASPTATASASVTASVRPTDGRLTNTGGGDWLLLLAALALVLSGAVVWRWGRASSL